MFNVVDCPESMAAMASVVIPEVDSGALAVCVPRPGEGVKGTEPEVTGGAPPPACPTGPANGLETVVCGAAFEARA